MQNPIPKSRQSSIISENQVIYLKNWKLWRAPTTILFRSWVINKNVKNECVENRSF